MSLYEEHVDFAKKVIAVRDAFVHPYTSFIDGFNDFMVYDRSIELVEERIVVYECMGRTLLETYRFYKPDLTQANRIFENFITTGLTTKIRDMSAPYPDRPIYDLFVDSLYTEEQHFQDSLLYSEETLEKLVILNMMFFNPLSQFHSYDMNIRKDDIDYYYRNIRK